MSQRELVRVAFDGPRLALDPTRRLPGRGAYVHARLACVTIPGLARSLRKTVTKADLDRIVAAFQDMSPARDNSVVKSPENDEDSENANDLNPGLAGANTVETQPRIKAKDDRSEDARV